MTPRVRELLSFYSSESPAILCRLAQVLNHGLTGGSGKLLVATVEDGIENGPAEAFAYNSDGYDPLYHFRMTSRAGWSSLVAPLGTIEFCARDFAGEFPWILKVNHTVTLSSYQSFLTTSEWRQALSLGAVGVSWTLPFPHENFAENLQSLQSEIADAKQAGLLVMLQLSRRGSEKDEVKQESLPLNQLSYGVHLACQMGAHLLSVPVIDPPVSHLKEFYRAQQIKTGNLAARASHVVDSAFAGQRIILGQFTREVNSAKQDDELKSLMTGGFYGADVRSLAHMQPEKETVADMKNFSRTLLGPEANNNRSQ